MPPRPAYPNGEFKYEPIDVQLEGKQILVSWQTPPGYGGNPGDMFWLESTQEFVVLHNKYSITNDPSQRGAVDSSGHREAYRGDSLGEALKAMQEIAGLESTSCTIAGASLSEQAERIGFSNKLDPARISEVDQVEF